MASIAGGSGSGAGWHWEGWARVPVRHLVAVLAAAIALNEVVAVRHAIGWRLGDFWLSPMLLPALLLGSLIGWRALGFTRRHLLAWSRWYLSGGVLLVAVAVAYRVASGSSDRLVQVVVAACEEELMFRLAMPLAAGYATALLLGRSGGSVADWGTGPRLVALGFAAAVFAVMPGHLAQSHASWEALPFVALGLLLTYVVLRTGDLLPGMLLHAILNLATLAYLMAGLPRALWAVIVVVALAVFAATTELAGRRLGLVVRRPPRDHDPAAVAGVGWETRG